MVGRRQLIQTRQILDSALATYRRLNHSATTREIAEEAGVSHAVLFQRFKKEEDLFFQSMLPRQIDVQTLVEPLNETIDEERLFRVAENIQRVFVQENGIQDALLLMTRSGFLEREGSRNTLLNQLITGLSNALQRLPAGSLNANITAEGAARLLVWTVFGAAFMEIGAPGQNLNLRNAVTIVSRAIF